MSFERFAGGGEEIERCVGGAIGLGGSEVKAGSEGTVDNGGAISRARQPMVRQNSAASESSRSTKHQRRRLIMALVT